MTLINEYRTISAGIKNVGMHLHEAESMLVKAAHLDPDSASMYRIGSHQSAGEHLGKVLDSLTIVQDAFRKIAAKPLSGDAVPLGNYAQDAALLSGYGKAPLTTIAPAGTPTLETVIPPGLKAEYDKINRAAIDVARLQGELLGTADVLAVTGHAPAKDTRAGFDNVRKLPDEITDLYNRTDDAVVQYELGKVEPRNVVAHDFSIGSHEMPDLNSFADDALNDARNLGEDVSHLRRSIERATETGGAIRDPQRSVERLSGELERHSIQVESLLSQASDVSYRLRQRGDDSLGDSVIRLERVRLSLLSNRAHARTVEEGIISVGATGRTGSSIENLVRNADKTMRDEEYATMSLGYATHPLTRVDLA